MPHLKLRKIFSKSYQRKVKEDHISIVIEPGSHFTWNFTPQTVRAKNTSTGFINCFKNNGDDLNISIFVGCESTVANTGVKCEKLI